MNPTATLTYNPKTHVTTLNGRACREPDGMVGVAATASMYAALGYDIVIRRARAEALT